MTEQKNALAELFAACWKDEALKARFMADPKAVLAEYGMAVPEGMNIKVVENSDSHVHLILPAPPAGHENLTDEELSKAAGGLSPEQLSAPLESYDFYVDQGPGALPFDPSTVLSNPSAD